MRQHAARVEHEQLEQLVLGARELGEVVADHHAVARAVELELAERERIGIALAIRAAHERAQARLQLAHVERLDEVVVGARVEAVDAVGDGVARREHQDRHAIAGRAQAPADLEAVDVRHADVEHDGVGHGGRGLGERLLAALRHLHLVAGERQRAAQSVAHGAIVIDNEDPHSPIVPACRAFGHDSYGGWGGFGWGGGGGGWVCGPPRRAP